MIAFEFQTSIKDGVIEVPAEYRDQLPGTVRIIILAPTTQQPSGIISQLLANPVQDEQFTPLTRDEIYQDRVRG
ncbi:MAG TPA: hypothetical protein VGD69_29760 [Herpetosiphonaceae bacterium]